MGKKNKQKNRRKLNLNNIQNHIKGLNVMDQYKELSKLKKMNVPGVDIEKMIEQEFKKQNIKWDDCLSARDALVKYLEAYLVMIRVVESVIPVTKQNALIVAGYKNCLVDIFEKLHQTTLKHSNGFEEVEGVNKYNFKTGLCKLEDLDNIMGCIIMYSELIETLNDTTTKFLVEFSGMVDPNAKHRDELINLFTTLRNKISSESPDFGAIFGDFNNTIQSMFNPEQPEVKTEGGEAEVAEDNKGE